MSTSQNISPSTQPNDNYHTDKASLDILTEFFGLVETGTQTDLLSNDIDTLIPKKSSLTQEQFIESLTNEVQLPFVTKNGEEPNASFFLGQKREKEDELLLKDFERGKEFYEHLMEDNINTNSHSHKNESVTIYFGNGIPKPIKKKIPAYLIFKYEYKQSHKSENDAELEKECKKAWEELDKDMKKIYNNQADNEFKKLKKQQQKIISQNKQINNLIQLQQQDLMDKIGNINDSGLNATSTNNKTQNSTTQT